MQRLKEYFIKRKVFVADETLNQLYSTVVTSTQGANQELEQRAFNVWLNSDLRTWCDFRDSRSVLSQLVSAHQKLSVISNPLILQIDSVRDISRPAYQQLQKVINRFGENVLVSDEGGSTASTQTTTFKKQQQDDGKRVLLLSLTDGLATIQAMEYMAINQLSTATPPGTKVRIMPPVTCRRGMLLLKCHNIQIIGGSVPSLVTKYSQKLVLASVLDGKEGFLEEMEKSTPPCPPPIAARHASNVANPAAHTGHGPFHASQAQVPRAPVRNAQALTTYPVNDDDNFHFDPEGDALIAQIDI